MFKKLILILASVIGGIYLTSEEGAKTRKKLLKKKSIFKPIIKDLLKQTNEILEGNKEIKSDEIKANIEKIISEAKIILINLDLEKTTETIQEAIKVASKKIRIAMNENQKASLIKKTKNNKITK
jgi:DNA polymerase III delta prime subunit